VLPEHRELLRAWYKRLVAIKRAFPALQRTNIEDALLEPQVKGLIAYNRWAGEEAVTVIVNLNPEPVECTVRTRFARGTAIRDLLSGEAFPGDPGSLRIPMPLTARGSWPVIGSRDGPRMIGPPGFPHYLEQC